MKKLFMVLTLLIIGLVGVNQTYAWTDDVIDYSDGYVIVYEEDFTYISFDFDDLFTYYANTASAEEVFVIEVTTALETATFTLPIGTYLINDITTSTGRYTIEHETGHNLYDIGTDLQLSAVGGGLDTYKNVNSGEFTVYSYVVATPDLELTDLTDGATLTQEQDDIWNQMFLGETPVTLTIDSTDYVLQFRSSYEGFDYITEANASDGTGGWRVYFVSGNLHIKDDTGATPTGTFSLGMNIPPTISGSGIYLSDYDNPATVADVQATLTAADDPDGDITANITVYEDNFTGNESVLGDHLIIFQVSDAAGSDTQFNVTVQVVDVTPAVITLNGETEITIGIGDAPCNYPGAYATDNVDGAEIQLDGVCNVDSSAVGTYTIEYDYTDTSGNVSDTAIVTVTVEDTAIPYVQSNVQTITTYNSQNMTLNQVLSGITVVDDHDTAFDGTYTVTVDNYTGNESIDGSYTVTLEATDASGNTMTHTITIVVIDDLPPVITASSYLLTAEEVAAMTQEEIRNHILSRTQ